MNLERILLSLIVLKEEEQLIDSRKVYRGGIEKRKR